MEQASTTSVDTEVDVHIGYRPFFWIFAVIGVVLFYYAMGYARKYYPMPAFIFPPVIAFCLVFDNIVMATIGVDRDRQAARALLAIHACVIPLLLLVCYELAYLVHKQKSVNFCGISFESGHRRILALSVCLRVLLWLIAATLLVINLLDAFHWSQDESSTRIGRQSIYDTEDEDSTVQLVLSVLPAFVLVLLSFYNGLQLWKYGTFYAYIMHATCFNPWIWMVVGSLALLAGYVMPRPIYMVTSNAGELAMLAAIVRMFREVHHDMLEGLQMREFINPITLASPPPSQSNSHSRSRSRNSQGPLITGDMAKLSPLSSAAPASSFHEMQTPKVDDVRLTAEANDWEPESGVSPLHRHHHSPHQRHTHWSEQHHHQQQSQPQPQPQLGNQDTGRHSTGSGTATASPSSMMSPNALHSVVVTTSRTNPLLED